MGARSVIVLLVLFFSGWSLGAEEINVAAAISLKESLEGIRPLYESSSGDQLRLTFASSGQIAPQIQNGAPVDVFLSAARKQVEDLSKAGKTVDGSVVVFASNELVLVVPNESKFPSTGFEDLANAKVHRVAVGEPRTVPAGEYAQQVLDHLKLTDTLKGRLIFGLNVRQVLQYVQSDEVDAGIVYASDAKQVKIIATASPDWHQPIEYCGVVITGAKHAGGAQKFLAYLRTEPAQQILQKNGFTKPTTRPAERATAAPGK